VPIGWAPEVAPPFLLRGRQAAPPFLLAGRQAGAAVACVGGQGRWRGLKGRAVFLLLAGL